MKNRIYILTLSCLVVFNFGLHPHAAAGSGDPATEGTECQLLLDLKSSLSPLTQFLKHVKKGHSRGTLVTREQAIFNTAAFITKKKVIPDRLVIPQILGAAYKAQFANLSTADQRTIRDELVKLAIDKHTPTLPTLLDKLSTAIVKHFAEHFTLPSFKKLAELIQTTDERAARLLFARTNINEAYNHLLKIAMQTHSAEFDKIRNQFLSIYQKRAREFGRTLSISEFYHGIVERWPEVEPSFTQDHLAYLMNEPMPSNKKPPSPYIRLFESSQHVYKRAHARSPKSFDQVLNKYEINKESHEKIMQLLKQKSRVFITAAAPGVEVHEEAMANLIKMAESMDGFIIVYAEAGRPGNIDPFLINHPLIHIIHDTIELTPWLKLNTLPVHFKRVDPRSPLRAPGRGGPREQMQIVGHPQMSDETTPTIDNHLFPRRLLTTGAITKPWYASKFTIGGVTDDQARDVHVIGALLLEKDRNDSGVDGLGTPGTYHAFQLEWSWHSHSFTDRGVRYRVRSDDKISRFKPIPKEEFEAQRAAFVPTVKDDNEAHVKLLEYYLQQPQIKTHVRPEYIIPGDKHIGGEDHFTFTQAEADAIRKYRPKRFVAHDLADNKSISHWDTQDIVIMAKKAIAGELDLSAELDKVVAYTNQILLSDPEIVFVVVESNHNNWLNRLLNEIQKLSQPINDPLVYEMMHAKLNLGIDPLEYYMKHRSDAVLSNPMRKSREGYVARLIDPVRVQFLPKGASLKFGPIDYSLEQGEHGHNSGGFKGGGISLHSSAGRSYTGINYGHTHNPGRNGRAGNAGASISPRQSYALGGASSAGMAFILAYDDGTFQVNQFNPHSNTYELGDGVPMSADEFFYVDAQSGQAWPRQIENEEKEKNVQTLDQFRRVRQEE